MNPTTQPIATLPARPHTSQTIVPPPSPLYQIIMLHHCLLKKSDTLDFAFELHSPLMMEGKNKEVCHACRNCCANGRVVSGGD